MPRSRGGGGGGGGGGGSGGGGGEGLPPPHASTGSGHGRGQVFDAVPRGQLRQVQLEGVRVKAVGRPAGRREAREAGG